jgi:hypothetical protein
LNKPFKKVLRYTDLKEFTMTVPGTQDTSRTTDQEVVDWTDLGREMWSFLTGREAAINYRFIDMAVEIPRDTGPEAPRATWKLNGTLQVTTRDNAGSPATQA